jgi:hypothetical protein
LKLILIGEKILIVIEDFSVLAIELVVIELFVTVFNRTLEQIRRKRDDC